MNNLRRRVIATMTATACVLGTMPAAHAAPARPSVNITIAPTHDPATVILESIAATVVLNVVLYLLRSAVPVSS